MRVKNVRMSVNENGGLVGYCPNCGSMITQSSSMFSCIFCEAPVEYTRTQELVEEIRKEILQLPFDSEVKVNELLDQIIIETGK